MAGVSKHGRRLAAWPSFETRAALALLTMRPVADQFSNFPNSKFFPGALSNSARV